MKPCCDHPIEVEARAQIREVVPAAALRSGPQVSDKLLDELVKAALQVTQRRDESSSGDHRRQVLLPLAEPRSSLRGDTQVPVLAAPLLPPRTLGALASLLRGAPHPHLHSRRLRGFRPDAVLVAGLLEVRFHPRCENMARHHHQRQRSEEMLIR
eukprot:scaffold859_cov306-Pinguiococcus_pyrenoidosus.AAC.13